MPAEKSDAIVLRITEFSETSCVMTLYTREFGKITGLAKGARRKKSPFESALDVLSVIRVVFLHKNTDAMDLLTEAKLERRFRSATSDWDRLNCAYYVVELLNGLTGTNDAQPALYDLAERTLALLDTGDGSPFLQLARFELQFLAELGHAPMLGTCVGCGQTVAAKEREFFGVVTGGVYCGRCRSGKTSVITLSQDAWQLLDELAGASGAPEANGVRERMEPYSGDSGHRLGLAEVRETLNQFVSHLMGSRPRVQAFLKLPQNRR